MTHPLLKGMRPGCYIGIDPGKFGALARLSVDNSGDCELLCFFFDNLTPEQVCQVVGIWASRSDYVAIEEVQGFKSQSATASFTFGFWAGMVYGAAFLLGGQAPRLLKKNKWAPLVGIRLLDQSDKQVAKALALELFPEEMKPSGRRRVVHEGAAEAALIAVALAKLVTKEKAA